MIRVEDWARTSPPDMCRLATAEQSAWRDELQWETTTTWVELDEARRAGRVPGFVARGPDRAVAGWTYYLRQGDELHIGALAATSPLATEALLDAVLEAPGAQTARRIVFFAYTSAPDAAGLLAARGFGVAAELYLVRHLEARAVAGEAFTCRLWRSADAEAVAETLGAAYAPDPRRAFASTGAPAEWRHYVRQLTMTAGCGSLLPACSPLAPDGGARVDGVALVTRISSTSAHLAQLAVRPEAGGAGLGSRLLTSALARASASGYAQLSLIVSEANTRARRLYAAHGFVRMGAFLSGTRQP